jgi:LacI family transcriptional regulator
MVMPGSTRTRHKEPRQVMLALDWYEREHRRGFARYAREAGWHMDHATPDSPERLKSWRGDGILCQLHPSAPTFLDLVAGKRAPMVELSDHVPEMTVPRVLPDRRKAVHLIVEHFLERGFRSFVYCRRNASRSQNMLEWCAERVQDAGCELVILTCSSRRPRRVKGQDDYQWLAHRLSEMPTPQAVITLTDELALGLVEACLGAGPLVPEQVAVAPLWDVEDMCEFARVPLTSILMDFEEQAYQAAALLDRLMDGEAPPNEPLLVPPKPLVVRQSTDIVAIEDVEVAKAVRYLMSNLHDKRLGVPDIVAATTSSRSALFSAFRKHVGRPIAEEIRRLRVEEAARLLRTTTRSASDIAESCGYSSLQHFRRCLHRETGCSPRQYRLRHS